MIIWFLFLTICYLLLIGYENPKINNKRKSYILVGLMLLCVYFSAFRDGLGSDYTAYQSYCERVVYHSSSWLLMEPFPALLYSLCYNTSLSAVLFFLVTSIIICVSSLWIYSRFQNFYLAAFLFLTYTNLYLASFNLVRQFTAASIVLLATYYFVMKNKSPLFFLFVILAFLWHKSAILCVFIYFLGQKRFNSFFWIFAIILSWIAPINLLFNIPIIGDLFNVLNYMDNVSHSEASYSRTSLSNIYMHIMLLICMIGKSKIKGDDKPFFYISLKLSIISVLFCNISANSIPFAYRYGIFFSTFLPILFSYLPSVINKSTAKLLVFIPITVLLCTVLVSRMGDRVFCPQRILPIESIYDKYYHPYENPEVQIVI